MFYAIVYDENVDEDEDDEFGMEDPFADSTLDPAVAIEFQTVPDDDENESDDTNENAQAKARPAPKIPRATMPSWLKTNYEDTRERLLAEMKKNVSSRPTCYDRGTFIDGAPYPLFSIEKRTIISPEDFYKPKYFVFLPHTLVGRIPCPQCHESGTRDKKNQPIFLTPNGFPKAPRRVVDLDENIYVIGYRYYCRTCSKSFQSWSPRLLSSLPRSLALQFTHHLSYRNGLTDRVVALMRGCFLQGIGPTPFASMIRTNHIRQYEQRHLQYLEALYERSSAPLPYTGKYQPFSEFNDRNGYAGYTPCGRYFRDFYVHFMGLHADETDQYTDMLSASILQIDHSFKVSSF